MTRPIAGGWKLLAVLAIVAMFVSAKTGFAQPPAAGTLRVTVVDPSGAVIVGATVTVFGAEESTRAATIAPVQTSDAGIALFAGLKPGRYAVEANFPGFEKRVLNDVRVRNGENRQTAVLTIQRVETAVTVEQDRQQAAADRQGTSFGTTLTRDQIDALSDDPATLQQQLQDMAGPGAVIRIDGFEGSALPAKAQIRSIRIARDQFAAEYHSAGGSSIEIITQPGVGPLRYYSSMQVRHGLLSGRSPFVPVKGPEQNVNYGIGLGGTLAKDRSSFNINAFGISSYETPNLNAALPNGTLSRALGLRAPRDNLYVNGMMDYALTLDQTLRVGYNLTRFTSDNAGVGGYDGPERAYSTDNSLHNLRVQHFGPIGRRAFSRSRLQLILSDSDAQSVTEAKTLRVLDAFTSGGAQRAGGDHATTVSLGSDLDYVLGRHSFRAGILLDSTWYHSNTTSNYLGTYTFDNLEAFEARRPSNFTQRVGDPDISYVNIQGGVYFQDDIRVRKNLTLTPGIRYELQTHVRSYADIGPRFGVTWAPFASGLTTLRTSAGVFYDWLPASTYDQSIRVDGHHQQEINIVNPSFPDPDAGADVPPANRYVLGSGYKPPRMTRVSAGIDQQFLKTMRVAATYSYQTGSRLARGLNLNAPVEGIRPNPGFANMVEVVSDARLRQHQLQIDATLNPGAMLPVASGPRVSWKRATVFMNYSLGSVRNDTDGPFSIPATGDLAGEWGPSGGVAAPVSGLLNGGPPPGASFGANDVRSRLNVAFNNQIVRNLLLALGLNASTAPPYSWLTGRDNNGDGVFNDRPPEVARNSLRAARQANLFMMMGYVFTFGHRAPLPPGVGVFGGGGAVQVRTFDQGTARYRLQLFVQAQNLTNEPNYVGYSGTETSPFFRQPTAVGAMRKIDFGINLSF